MIKFFLNRDKLCCLYRQTIVVPIALYLFSLHHPFQIAIGLWVVLHPLLQIFALYDVPVSLQIFAH